MRDPSPLKAIARVFLKLGCIGFGGPAAHIAMMETEVVKKRKWLSEAHFLDLVGATNLIPGPNSTEMAMHCGYERGGRKGLMVAGACFILPAVIITAAFAWAYQQYGRLPAVRPFISSATFIGWQIAGWPGAITATVGIFLPSFLFVAFLNPLIPRLRRSGIMSAFLDTVNMAAVAIILAVCMEMGKVAITDWRTTLIAISGFAVMLLFPRLNTAWVVLGGGATGYLLSLV